MNELNLEDYGLSREVLAQVELDTDSIPARVLAVHRERYELICEHGKVAGRLKSSTYFAGSSEDFPTTGDFVLIHYNPTGESLIVKTLPRGSFFSRRDPDKGRGEQAVAANFDYVFIMQSLNQDFNLKRLERYITLAWQSGGVPVLILTKADLVPDFEEQMEAVREIAFGVDIHAVSAKAGTGLEALTSYLQPRKTVVFLGSSGVGKSCLVNRLADKEIMEVREIRDDDDKGRHTTTHRQLLLLENGSMIIDTPGMRELGMWAVDSGLSEAFSDVEGYFPHCKFSDCQHKSEPGCAVREALEIGDLSWERWESYLRLQREARYAEDRAAYLQISRERGKALSKWSKQKRKDWGEARW